MLSARSATRIRDLRIMKRPGGGTTRGPAGVAKGRAEALTARYKRLKREAVYCSRCWIWKRPGGGTTRGPAGVAKGRAEAITARYKKLHDLSDSRGAARRLISR